MNAHISASIKKDGAQSPYIRVAKGTFALANPATTQPVVATGKLTPTVTESEEVEEQYAIVSSFGMFWRRNAIEWNTNPKLLGMQQIGATAVDFNKQLGLYLLYDGREAIYIGPPARPSLIRAHKRPNWLHGGIDSLGLAPTCLRSGNARKSSHDIRRGENDPRNGSETSAHG